MDESCGTYHDLVTGEAKGKVLRAGTARASDRKVGVYQIDTGNWILDVESDLPTGKSHQQMHLTPKTLSLLMAVLPAVLPAVASDFLEALQRTLDDPEVKFAFSNGVLETGLDDKQQE